MSRSCGSASVVEMAGVAVTDASVGAWVGAGAGRSAVGVALGRAAVGAGVMVASGANRIGVGVGSAVGCAKAWQPLNATNKKNPKTKYRSIRPD
jgi:hypothetical protein